MARLRRETTNPNDIASRRWWRDGLSRAILMGVRSTARSKSVPRITRRRLKDYVRQGLRARQIEDRRSVGDIDAATLGAMLDQVFGALPAKGNAGRSRPAPCTRLGRAIDVDLKVPQAVLRFGGPASRARIRISSRPIIVNHILGGGSFSSRLYREVREKRGLVYGVYS